MTGSPSSRRARPGWRERASRLPGCPGRASASPPTRSRSGKPDPEGYLRAASALGIVDPGVCVVLEDAPAGVAAARAAGMAVVGVLTSHTRDELGAAHAFVPDLLDVPKIAARLVA